jgi:hypothetical protein
MLGEEVVLLFEVWTNGLVFVSIRCREAIGTHYWCGFSTTSNPVDEGEQM